MKFLDNPHLGQFCAYLLIRNPFSLRQRLETAYGCATLWYQSSIYFFTLFWRGIMFHAP
jgi:hypothetical protein